MIEKIVEKDNIYAIIIRNNYHSEGIEFFTPGTYSQQLGYMNRKKGYKIEPHIHIEAERIIHFTEEVLVVKKGTVRVDFYNLDEAYFESSILSEGDIILLARGGHGFEILEDAEIFEIKQGPYMGDKDKRRFKK